MDAADLILGLSILLNAGGCALLAWHFRRRLCHGCSTEARAQRTYAGLCLGVGLFSGVMVFWGLMALLHIPAGHGEVLLAGPALNVLVSFAGIVAGRIHIGWEPMKW